MSTVKTNRAIKMTLTRELVWVGPENFDVNGHRMQTAGNEWPEQRSPQGMWSEGARSEGVWRAWRGSHMRPMAMVSLDSC